MRTTRLFPIFAFLLVSSVAYAGSVCIQDDTNGDVVVLLKSSFKRGRGGAASGYLANYSPVTNSYLAYPITVGMVTSTGGYVGIGFTQYAPNITTNGSLLSNLTVFHHIACTLGADGKISVLDLCSDVVTSLGGSSTNHPMHVVDCIDDLRIP
jgi:hypothetical protein